MVVVDEEVDTIVVCDPIFDVRLAGDVLRVVVGLLGE